MNALLDFIRRGTVGELRLGLHRAEVEQRLGKPEGWLGKPPTFGPHVRTPEEAEAWTYYEAAGVRFNRQGLAVSVTIMPERMNKERDPFRLWPIGPGVQMGQLRALFVEYQIDFEEGEDQDPRGYFLLAERRCTALTLGRYESGTLVPEHKRLVSLLKTVVSEDHLPDFLQPYRRAVYDTQQPR